MKRLLILAILCLTQTVQAKDLTLFVIHGLGGEPGNFCQMKEGLEEHYKNQNLRVHYINYSTMNDTATTLQFADEVADQVNQYFKDNNLPNNSPYSFLVHSQGGIVSLKYLYSKLNDCFDREGAPRRSCSVPFNFQDLITMGTPFWGSQGANMSQIPWIEDIVKKYSGQYKQIEQLRVGSLSLSNSRRALLSRISNNGEFENPFRFGDRVRFHNMAGEFTSYVTVRVHAFNFAENDALDWGVHKVLLGGERQEYDVIVSPSSARMDFHYLVEERTTGRYRTGRTNLVKNYYLAPTSHIPLKGFQTVMGGLINKYDDVDALGGMVCKNEGDDGHLGFNFVKNILDQYYSGQEKQPIAKPEYPEASPIQNFMVELQIYLPSDFPRRPRLERKDISILPGESGKIKKKDVVFKAGQVFRAEGFNNDTLGANNKKFISFYHDGRFNGNHSDTCCFWDPLGSAEPPKSHLKYKIKPLGFEEVNFELPVQATYSSFARVYLKPYRPISANLKEDQVVLMTYKKLKQNDVIVSAGTLDDVIRFGVIRHGTDSSNVTFETVSIDKEDYQKNYLRNLPHLAEIYSKLSNQCYYGFTALEKTPTFNNIQSLDQKDSLKDGVKVHIVGRYARKARVLGVRGLDRYLVVVPQYHKRPDRDKRRYGITVNQPPRDFNGIEVEGESKRLAWMNVEDVDILQGHRCVNSY